MKIKVKCDNCKKEIEISQSELKLYVHHFCKNNRKCMSEWYSKNFIGKNSHVFKERIKVKCDWCNKILYRNESSANKNKHYFCNTECEGCWLSKNKSGKKSHSYIHGRRSKLYPKEFYNIRD